MYYGAHWSIQFSTVALELFEAFTGLGLIRRRSMVFDILIKAPLVSIF